MERNKIWIRVVAARSKAKAKPQPRVLAGTTANTIKRYSEKKMEQLNSTKSNSIFEIILHKYSIGLMIVGKLVWLQEEVRNEDISIVLIVREQFSTSALFKVILEAISLILRYWTLW